MGLPPVVVGLAVAMSLWRSGPLGDCRLIYTPAAIVIAQVIIAFPVVTGLDRGRACRPWIPDCACSFLAWAPRAFR